jgi:hypothetical protein
MVSQSQAQDISSINDSGGGDDSGAYFGGNDANLGITHKANEGAAAVSGSPFIGGGNIHAVGGSGGRNTCDGATDTFDGGLDHDVVLAGDEFGGNVANLGFTHKANEGAASWSYS